MSTNSLMNLVPVLDGTNYHCWVELMKAYLQQQGSWIMINLFGDTPAPMLSEEGTNRNKVIEWAQQEAKAQGSIRLRLNAEVSHIVKDKMTTKSLWDALKDVYGSTSGIQITTVGSITIVSFDVSTQLLYYIFLLPCKVLLQALHVEQVLVRQCRPTYLWG